jgi:chemotaxis protein CheX
MSEPKLRQSLLLVDDGAIDPSLIQAQLGKMLLEKHIQLTLVVAQDGAKASTKFANQKFDAVVVNTTVARLGDSGLQNHLDSPKDGFRGPLYILSDAVTDRSQSWPRAKKFGLPLDPEKLISALLSDLVAVAPSTVAAPSAAKPASHAAYAVDVRVINAIISSTLKVLAQFNMKITMGKPATKALDVPMAGSISSVLEIVSKSFRGQLSVSFDEASFLEMASGMLCEEQTEINDFNRDAVGEVNNIIFGNAKPDLTTYGIEFTIPKVVLGAGQLMKCPAGSASLRVPFDTGRGHFYIDLIAYP